MSLRSALLAAPLIEPLPDGVEPTTPALSPRTEAVRLDPSAAISRTSRPTRTRTPSAVVAVALIAIALVVIGLLVATTDLGQDLLDRSTSSSGPATGPDERTVRAAMIEG